MPPAITLDRLSKEEDTGASYLVIIMSDGEENSSIKVSSKELAEKIQKFQATGRWTFTYIGSNQDLSKIQQVLNIPHGTLRLGSVADVTILDPDYTMEVNAMTLRSRSTNSPFLGWRLRGAAMLTIVGGRVIFERTEER